MQHKQGWLVRNRDDGRGERAYDLSHACYGTACLWAGWSSSIGGGFSSAKEDMRNPFRRKQPPPPPPPPASAVPDLATCVLSLLTAWLLVTFLRKRFFHKLKDHVSAKLKAEHERFLAEEDAQARYRFTAGRLEKALPPGGAFDAIFIGSGPGSLACAATMSKLGWKCAVFEQGEQVRGQRAQTLIVPCAHL